MVHVIWNLSLFRKITFNFLYMYFTLYTSASQFNFGAKYFRSRNILWNS
jgi:hypothetical protein